MTTPRRPSRTSRPTRLTLRASVITALERIVAVACDETKTHAGRVGHCRSIAEITLDDLRRGGVPTPWPRYEVGEGVR